MNEQVKEKKKWSHRYVAVCIAIIALLSITGCSSGDSSAVGGRKSDKIPIKIEDIDWSVSEGIVEGERAVVFNYTNNTKYVIADIELKFTQKDDVTTEDLVVFNDYKEQYDVDDEKMADIYILGYNRKFAEPGETLENSPCVINGTYIPVDNITQYEIMQPDMATISYIGKDNKLYGVYYDFKTQAYSKGTNDGIELYQWSESELSNLIPKPNVKTVRCSESSTSLGFTSYGASKEQYTEYVQACKDKGFTIEPSSGETYYNAKNEDGYKISIHYYANDERLDGNLYTP